MIVTDDDKLRALKQCNNYKELKEYDALAQLIRSEFEKEIKKLTVKIAKEVLTDLVYEEIEQTPLFTKIKKRWKELLKKVISDGFGN